MVTYEELRHGKEEGRDRQAEIGLGKEGGEVGREGLIGKEQEDRVEHGVRKGKDTDGEKRE